MLRNEAKEYIIARSREHLRPDNSGKGYICPICGSGSGKNGTGITTKDGIHFTCWGKGNCFTNSDIIDIIGIERGLTNYKDKLKAACEEYGITLDAVDSADIVKDAFSDRAPAMRAAEPFPTIDRREYYKSCCEHLKEPEPLAYLQRRGISIDTAERFNIGFDRYADPARSNHPQPRLILPVTAEYYIARSIDPNTPKQYAKMNPKGAAIGLFNLSCLHKDEISAVFVTEGYFDALSVIEAGAAAIALNSVSNADKLISHLKEQRTTATLILCLDNDEAGAKATQTLRSGLQRLNISYVTADICNGYKDPNEALTGDREAFSRSIAAAQKQTAAKPDNISAYIDDFMGADIDAFKEAKDRKTGFTRLDTQARGLYAGLYVVGAISSLGKTTFCHQIADQLAAAGEDVLFFSLEQSRLELVSKSLSRRTAQRDIKTAVNSLSIRRGYLPERVLKAADEYKQDISDRLSVIEGNFACNISFIGDYIRNYIHRNNKKPVVFVDYLQILQPEKDERGRTQTTKETVDNTVTELKRISREQGLTVFVISSLNRTNYLTPVDFESFKESGGIEYTADVVWGLQLQCMNDDIFDKKESLKAKRAVVKAAKRENPRKIELICLKNRYGISSFSCYFDYYPEFDLFVEDTITAPGTYSVEAGATVATDTKPKAVRKV